MNKKALLLTIFAATFSAATFACVSEVTTTIEETQEVTIELKPIAVLKKVIDQELLNHCAETNTALCQEFLPLLIALTNQIDLDADAAIAFEEMHNALKAELNNHSKPTTILEDAASNNEEASEEVCKALMIIQDQN